MKNDITITYRDHEIIYDEQDNMWTCDVFTHRQGSPSLALAKKRIDKLLDGDEQTKPVFERVQAWYFDYNKPIKVTLTSKTEDGYYCTKPGGKREKLRSYDMSKLYADTMQNEQRIHQFCELDKQQRQLGEKMSQIRQSLTPFQP